MESEVYRCHICGRKGVKLWRPKGDSEPFICANCAEKRQLRMTYNKRVWLKNSDGTFDGVNIFKWIPLPPWNVNAEGLVPSYDGPGPDGIHEPSTEKLIIFLEKGLSERQYGKVELLPAIPHKNGGVWTYAATPEECMTWWRNLPTR